MNFKTVICEVILVFSTFSDISAEFDKERFSRVRYLVSNKNDLSLYQNQNKPVFQWDSTFPQETTKTPENQNQLDKRRKKRKHRPNSLPIQESMELANSTETISDNIAPRKKKNRRRKKLRKNRKQKNQEITTIPTNLSLDELIKKVNENPEGKFNNLNGNILLQNTDKSPIKGLENATKFINLTVETENPKMKKPRRKNRKKSRCRFNNGGCSQLCRLKGAEKCACSKGYILDKDKRTCIDIDECQTSNGGCHSICDNKIGAHECKCNPGFRLGDDGKSCVDINECILNNGHGPCEDICHNTIGSYQCECRNGTVLMPDEKTCADIDECAEGKSGCSHNCINTFGGAFCACPDGLELSADWKTCQDINECDDENIRRSCNNNCINTVGSYKCNDYQNDENFRVPVCKPLNLPSKGYLKCSRSGAFKLFSSQGRPRIVNSPGTTCDLICPIGYKLNGKHHVTCSFNGQWEGSRKGVCKKSPPPSIQCPLDQYFKLKKEASSTIVRFPKPITNMKWDLVKSHPKWAKRLIGKLNEGRHKIRFEVTDPGTKLRSYCYFKVYIVRYQIPNYNYECAEGKSGCSHNCINTFGGAFCACPDGLELSADWKTCQDINECDDENIRKSCNNNYINTIGSYKCNDYQNDENFRVPVCKPLNLPSKGYLKCSRSGAFKLFSSQGRPRIVNSPGTTCDLICPIGYKLNGKHHVTCSFNGQWEGSRKGVCKKSPPPTIQCPLDQYFKLKKEASSTIVRFLKPITNMKWDLVKSYPKWAKRLIGKLNEGRYKIRFEVTDPGTKLRSYCYFKVYIVRYQS